MIHQAKIAKYTKLKLNPAWNIYTCIEASDKEMTILGNMLADDVRDNALSYKQTISDHKLRGQGGNFTFMEKENGYVLISDLYAEEPIPTEFKISQQSFIHLLDEWQDKVYKSKPQDVIITYNDDRFNIETKKYDETTC